MSITAKQIFDEYEKSTSYKESIGNSGLYSQTKKNERFYSGDQWNGAKIGNDRPLLRHNLIKRIGDFKIAILDSSPLTVNFSAEGVPNTVEMQKQFDDMRDELAQGQLPQGDNNTAFVMGALTDYYKTVTERLGFDEICHDALKNAYISGTGILYTYWDENIKTGLYADETKDTAIKGDIMTQCIDIENVEFGNPAEDDVQKQPYIIISQRKTVDEVKRMAEKYGVKKEDIEKIKPDSNYEHFSGDRATLESTDSKKITLLIRLYKEYDKKDKDEYKIMCVFCVPDLIIREPFDIGIKKYPIAKMVWDKRRNCAYGDSEVTHLIPNQIAINRMLTANAWAVMMMGMPLMLVNDDVIGEPVTNTPGQIIYFKGSPEDFNNAINYITPPNFSSQYLNNANDLIQNTLTQAGANDTALGDIRPDNTSAILAVREASTMPLNPFRNRYYKFIEDNARIWAEFWVNKYGDRQLKIEDTRGIYYIPFIAENYKDLIISVRIDVGASNMWSEITAIQSLDSLLASGVITPEQYLERLPKGTIPNVSGLIKELQAQREQAEQAQSEQKVYTEDDVVAGLSPQEQEMFNALSDEDKAELLSQL